MKVSSYDLFLARKLSISLDTQKSKCTFSPENTVSESHVQAFNSENIPELVAMLLFLKSVSSWYVKHNSKNASAIVYCILSF